VKKTHHSGRLHIRRSNVAAAPTAPPTELAKKKQIKLSHLDGPKRTWIFQPLKKESNLLILD
jgi:hypothetical protein